MIEPELVTAILTPHGRGAVATVVIEGQRAVEAIGTVFQPNGDRPFIDSGLGEIRFGRWGARDGEEVVVCRPAAARVEIHCHGGIAAAAAIVETLVERGTASIDWRTWLAREHGDRLAAEAAEALAQAVTARAASVLLDQYDGALRCAVEQIREFVAARETSNALREADVLLDRYRLGKHLVEPFRIVLAGRPNVGKSSLINRLAGYQRAIVFDQPGTTRDVVTLRTAVDGWPVELADTAGIRATADALEGEGVARARARLNAADLRILVFDASHPWSIEDQQLLDAWPCALAVMNKSDLRAEGPAASSSLAERTCLHTSATSGQGIDELVSLIGASLVRDPLVKGAAVPFTARQHELLAAACKALRGKDHATAMSALAAL